MKLSIVIICWNDVEDIGNCLASVYAETASIDFEVIVTDNGSTDGSIALVRAQFPQAKLLENGVNLGFAGANNRAFQIAVGEYVLALNPDTVIRDRALEKLVAYADRHPEAGAFGCRVVNPDGSYQTSAYPIPTVRSSLVAALHLRWLGRLSSFFIADTYVGWQGDSEREIGFQAGCCLLLRNDLLRKLGGFDEWLFFQTEDADLCLRVAQSGVSVRFHPGAIITHIGGQNRGRYPIPVVLETQRSFYRFFFKHYGEGGARKLRWVALISSGLRFAGRRADAFFRPSPAQQNRLAMYRVLLRWHWKIDPVRFVRSGEEPDVGHKPLNHKKPNLAPAGQAGNR